MKTTRPGTPTGAVHHLQRVLGVSKQFACRITGQQDHPRRGSQRPRRRLGSQSQKHTMPLARRRASSALRRRHKRYGSSTAASTARCAQPLVST
jgi:hypothetical protein